MLSDASLPCYLDRDHDGFGAGEPVARDLAFDEGDDAGTSDAGSDAAMLDATADTGVAGAHASAAADAAGMDGGGSPGTDAGKPAVPWPPRVVTERGDCDDENAAVAPGEPEACDSIDNDCDGETDEGSLNACGGACATVLRAAPGVPCTNEQQGACAREGHYVCDSPDRVVCDAPAGSPGRRDLRQPRQRLRWASRRGERPWCDHLVPGLRRRRLRPGHPGRAHHLHATRGRRIVHGVDRHARLSGHDARVARIVRGLDGAIADADVMTLAALDESHRRSFDLRVAGPAALLVAKAHKINERKGTDRQSDKDALDVLRLLRGTETDDLATRCARLLADRRCEEAAKTGRDLLEAQFAKRNGAGVEMAIRSAGALADPSECTRMELPFREGAWRSICRPYVRARSTGRHLVQMAVIGAMNEWAPIDCANEAYFAGCSTGCSSPVAKLGGWLTRSPERS